MQLQILQGLEFERSTLDIDGSNFDNGLCPREQARNSSAGSVGSLRNAIVPILRDP